ncbi:MAG: hypothetical protein OEV91_07750, partial [Desulfobulbaceae bacterium]|nr:hypothetical protein [Desulfobulbaceae bacterium]
MPQQKRNLLSLTDYQSKFIAYELTRRCPSDSVEKFAAVLVDAQVDLNPHQVDAALFAFTSILERDALKWFKPAKGQLQIYYRQGTTPLEYQPDFVAETNDTIYMLEPKASNQMNDPVVLAKKESAVEWCANAS